MKKIIYVIGAGFNRNIKHDEEITKIPLAYDFFTCFLNKKSMEKYAAKFENVYNYLEKKWKTKLNQIKMGEKKIDLEELLSELEFKISNEVLEKRKEFIYLKGKIEEMIFYLFSSYEFTSYNYSAMEILRFARKFLSENNSDIITFNYDNILESAMEIESGEKKTSRVENEEIRKEFERMKSSKYNETNINLLNVFKKNYNRILSYAFKFDYYTNESMFLLAPLISGNDFFSVNNLYNDNRILKLHGSISWFNFINKANKYPHFDHFLQDKMRIGQNKNICTTLNSNFIDLEGHSIEESERDLFDFFGWRIEPILIVPTMLKKYLKKPFRKLWGKTKKLIQNADEIVIIGYSFPPTDFASKILFRENIKSDITIKIINPDKSFKNYFLEKVLRDFDYSNKIYDFSTLSEYLDFEGIIKDNVHLVVFRKSRKILDYAIGLKMFNRNMLRAKNISLKGINTKLDVIEFNKEIPSDFKRDSHFYFQNGKIVKMSNNLTV